MPKTTSKKPSRIPQRKASSAKIRNVARQASPKTTKQGTRSAMGKSPRAEQVAARQALKGGLGVPSLSQKSVTRAAVKGAKPQRTTMARASRSIAGRRRK